MYVPLIAFIPRDESGSEAAINFFVDPAECIDCGACVPACTSDSILPVDDVPEETKHFIEHNAAYFKN